MKNFVLSLLLAFAPLPAFAAHDHQDTGSAPAPEAAPATEVAATDAAHVAGSHASADAVAANDRKPCVRETGTRISARDKDGCTGQPGESYDREDIDRSGAVDTADAIRKLSPSATIRH